MRRLFPNPLNAIIENACLSLINRYKCLSFSNSSWIGANIYITYVRKLRFALCSVVHALVPKANEERE